MEENQPQQPIAYKPNIYPIIYWAILYGAIAALALVALTMLASFITVLWFPVFLAGLIWGGFRKYKQDKAAWMQGKGLVGTSKSPVEEFKDAARDIAQASRDMVQRHAQEDATVAAEQAQAQEDALTPTAEDQVAPAIPQEQEGILTEESEAPQNQQPPIIS